MQAIADFVTWLFNDKMGVLCLIAGGIVICLVIALVMERKTKQRYFDHEKSEDDWSPVRRRGRVAARGPSRPLSPSIQINTQNPV